MGEGTLFFDDWGTGSDMLIPASEVPNYPSASDWSLRDVISGAGSIFDSAIGAYGKVISAQTAADNLAFERQMKTMQLDTTKTIYGIQGDVAKTQAQTALAKAQQAFNSATGIGQNNSYSGVMLLLTIAGVAIAFMGMKK